LKIANFSHRKAKILLSKSRNGVGFWGSAPDPAGGAYSAPPNPLAGFGLCFVAFDKKECLTLSKYYDITG